jgi:glucose-1-phosphate adenylyltransferase
MMMGADYYQTESEIASLLAEGKVPVGVGENTKIRYDHVTENYFDSYRIPYIWTLD